MALPLYIPRCIHTPASQCHLPPPDKPLRIQIEGPLIAIQRLLPHIPWRLDPLDRTFPQPAGPELARLTYQKVYGRDISPEVPGDLVVRDEYLGWMPEKRPQELIDYYGVTFDHLVPPDDTNPEVLQINIIEIEDDNVIYGVYGLVKLYQKRHATLSRSVPYFGLMGVGACSAGYHMTLKYHTQMSDELSMHLLVTPLLYRIFTFQTSLQHTRLIGILFLTEFTVVMVVHMVMNEFLLHAVTFGLGVLLIATQTIKLVSQRVPHPFTRKKLRNIGLFGVCSFVFGYMVWLIDEWACNPLIRIRHSVGLPLAFVFELHGWWHVFTAIGGYIAVEVVDMITSGEVHEDPTDQFAWPIADVARFIGGAPGTKKLS
ncbi:hypothetical protein Aspvir_009293 [Aspergillus viridinutans]|uniref:Alkaline phytoceramidase n=1 Tax=Aspergillus viridinutans TaxID=75553 RepID=A0A9P3BZL9_ASPVI|nr:uncharacterized protein Aspvir_009293 [Aspergillus viridinutans]GIK05190.1 hypothetical protein Aspvir_009293 [Aspergillus viridinutans]